MRSGIITSCAIIWTKNHRFLFSFVVFATTLPLVCRGWLLFWYTQKKNRELFRSDSKKNSFCVHLSVCKQISWFNAQNLNDSIKCGALISTQMCAGQHICSGLNRIKAQLSQWHSIKSYYTKDERERERKKNLLNFITLDHTSTCAAIWSELISISR